MSKAYKTHFLNKEQLHLTELHCGCNHSKSLLKLTLLLSVPQFAVETNMIYNNCKKITIFSRLCNYESMMLDFSHLQSKIRGYRKCQWCFSLIDWTKQSSNWQDVHLHTSLWGALWFSTTKCFNQTAVSKSLWMICLRNMLYWSLLL